MRAYLTYRQANIIEYEMLNDMLVPVGARYVLEYGL